MMNFVTRFSRVGDSYLVQAVYPLADDVSFVMSDLGLVIFDVVSVILFRRFLLWSVIILTKYPLNHLLKLTLVTFFQPFLGEFVTYLLHTFIPSSFEFCRRL